MDASNNKSIVSALQSLPPTHDAPLELWVLVTTHSTFFTTGTQRYLREVFFFKYKFGQDIS